MLIVTRFLLDEINQHADDGPPYENMKIYTETLKEEGYKRSMD